MTVSVLSVKKQSSKILNETIDIFAKEAKVNDEGKGAAEAFAVFQGSVGTGVHHELLGKLRLGEFFALASLEKAVGHVGTESTFAGVLHRENLSFVNIRMKRILSIVKE